jgi:hypothetical protein
MHGDLHLVAVGDARVELDGQANGAIRRRPFAGLDQRAASEITASELDAQGVEKRDHRQVSDFADRRGHLDRAARRLVGLSPAGTHEHHHAYGHTQATAAQSSSEGT